MWFDDADFAYVAPSADAGAQTPDANGVVDIAGTLAWEGFIRGVKKGTGYELFIYEVRRANDYYKAIPITDENNSVAAKLDHPLSAAVSLSYLRDSGDGCDIGCNRQGH